ncbi:MAG TPA: hypothetical protein VFC21_12920 [Bryobacteraceae bacterium]|nr:hypothetical protein [Bryobacteraceae bacterium]
MRCNVVDIGNGVRAFVCGARPRTEKCTRCGRRADKLCDYPVAAGETCDAAICDTCGTHVAPDLDYCTEHALLMSVDRLYEEQEREAIEIEGMRTIAQIEKAENKQWSAGRNARGIFARTSPLRSEQQRKAVR